MNKRNAPMQILISQHYRDLVRNKSKLPSLNEIGFKVFSQTDEDGILLYIFSVIGTTNKTSVEICAGDGIECNTANLIINHGWYGLLVDGNPSLVEKGKQFYQNDENTWIFPPKFVCSWITKNNVNHVIQENGCTGEIDLLSIDIDGMDFWIWDAINVIKPRVVVIEYNDIIGPKLALTVPYSDNFNAYEYPTTNGMPNYSGASLPAMVKQGKKKGID